MLTFKVNTTVYSIYNKIKSEDFNNIVNIRNIKTIKNKTNRNNINNEVNILKCKHCNNKDTSKIVKCGFNSSGKQRYKCKECSKTFGIREDNRIKHTIAERRICITLYLNSMNMRGIQKFLSSEFNKKYILKV